MPVMQLKTVVLPAPFGPMRPTISPRPTVISTASKALRPPKFMVIFVRFSTISILCPSGIIFREMEFVGAAHIGDYPLRAEDHHEDHGRPEDEHPVITENP